MATFSSAVNVRRCFVMIKTSFAVTCLPACALRAGKRDITCLRRDRGRVRAGG